MTCPNQAAELAEELKAYIDRAVRALGGSTTAVNPGNRVIFSWPPHPASYGFHLSPSDWSKADRLEVGGEVFDVEVAETPSGPFGRIPELWFEARASRMDELRVKLARGVEPLLNRQRLIAQVLERPNRFTGRVGDLAPGDLLKLLYCPDRDVANDGRREIETRASLGLFFPALITVLQDDRHPYRRSAQWACLDLFEDLGCFARTDSEWMVAVNAIKSLIWNADDDYARTIYKAGVVLGGHVPSNRGGAALLDCLQSPSRIGRRSAIHALYHYAEWTPDQRMLVIAALEGVSVSDPEPKLRQYAGAMAQDVQRADTVHAEDVWFEGEV